MRKFLLGIVLPLLILLLIVAGAWWVRQRATTPNPVSTPSATTATQIIAAQDLNERAETPIPNPATSRLPTDADRAKDAQAVVGPMEPDAWEPGESPITFVPGVDLREEEAPATPTPSTGSPQQEEDEDNDGLTTQEERQYGTSAVRADTDGDGLTDGDEVHKYQTRPINPDTDGDGLTDGEEVMRWGTNPTNADTDGDGYPDGEEVKGGYNPNGPGRL